MTGIEPAFRAWEARVLPLNYTRVGTIMPDEGTSKHDPNAGAEGEIRIGDHDLCGVMSHPPASPSESEK